MNSSISYLNEGWKGIIFCNIRLKVISLSLLLCSLKGSTQHVNNISEILNCNECHPIRPHFIIGSNCENTQITSLNDFKNGKYNLLLATNVIEEGLDVGTCQLVINFDCPNNVKSMIQRRGRARASFSKMVVLVPIGPDGEVIIRDLSTFHSQESEMKLHHQNHQIDDVDELICDDASKIYKVWSTGAVVDIWSATQLVMYYCQHLPRDFYYQPQPIYHMDGEFQCAILLPAAVPKGWLPWNVYVISIAPVNLMNGYCQLIIKLWRI